MMFSFVIPVYCVERYLPQCVDSILGQTCRDFEIILVNDGSPDRCPQICDDYADSHGEVRVIHKANGGLADARNAGIAAARGDYIICVDSDDFWASPDDLAAIAAVAAESRPDVIFFGADTYDEATGRRRVSRHYDPSLNDLDAQAIVRSVAATGNFPQAAWMLAVRRDHMLDHRIAFRKGVTAEDYDWIIAVVKQADTIRTVDRQIYQYRQAVEGSITSRPRATAIDGIHNAISNWLNGPVEGLNCINDILSRVYLIELLNYAGLSADDRKRLRPTLLADAAILGAAGSPLYAAVRWLIRLAGVNASARLVKTLYRLKT